MSIGDYVSPEEFDAVMFDGCVYVISETGIESNAYIKLGVHTIYVADGGSYLLFYYDEDINIDLLTACLDVDDSVSTYSVLKPQEKNDLWISLLEGEDFSWLVEATRYA